MRSKLAFLIAVCLGIFFLGFCPATATNASNLTNYTFDELGFEAKTFSSDSNQEVDINFNSTKKYPEGNLFPHLLVVTKGGVTIKINNVSLFSEELEKGEYLGNIKIPTGLIQEGLNRLSFIFSQSEYNSLYPYYEITMLGDSAISILN